ncbi:pyridoxine 5'-phosphate synthase [Parvicella tangerina]|uniref:Pyridoxine 5'-phosphate synthase n=1 Tax=Parvicella tangerina TaxID=2829795 RepID=A0A916N9C4_9FLAO|nr:pyridoxine 5'-phosphate synthase [Parvicella tangerina]CAG5078710.1 Pyridoxine 5'-phosphate synthase [Parvicella tangerina]
MTQLSVNVNKIATLRNARGGNTPNLIQMALDAEKYGAQGITVHPRPDERHIRYSDVYELKEVLTTEFNIEGNPKEEKFIALVLKTQPHQVTLVPDATNQITSNHGWNTIEHKDFLIKMIDKFKEAGIRTSIFVDPDPKIIEGAKETGTDRIELYTESYAQNFATNKAMAIEPFVAAAKKANELEIGLNAGHDLSLENLRYFSQNIPGLLEVSIGHALVADALYFGWENTIRMYRNELT